ncbi:MAG: Crp/Fnr family transcriptional regulator [Sporomusaceae bacterium]|nr:Crp/Fnr family transcriptional regulator [Sporomusaceae bacterium]
MENYAALLQRSYLFKNKRLGEIQLLLRQIHYRVQDFSENELIFTAGQPASTLGIILSGRVAVQKIFPTGKIMTVSSRGNFDLLADATLFAQTSVYPATLCAAAASRIFLLPKPELLKLFAIDQTIMLNFLCSVSNRIFMLNDKIELLSLSSIQAKIAHYLISASESSGSAVVRLPFSKKAWAEHLNVSRTSLSRELRQMATSGLISFSQRRIVINDSNGLQQILL